jgi:hypothetical protein
MDPIILNVCVSAVTIIIIAVGVYLILTLIQVRNTARQVELLVQDVHVKIDNIENSVMKINKVISAFSSPITKIVGLAMSTVFNLFKKK